MSVTIAPICISGKLSIKDTMRVINSAALKGAPTGIALIVGKDRKLLGVVTDGDIRRAIVSGMSIDMSVEKIMIKNPVIVHRGMSESEMLSEVTRKVLSSGRIRDIKVNHVIVVDAKGRVDDVIDFFELWKSADQKSKKVCVVGLGFVGLTLAAVLVDVGFKVIGFDISKKIVNMVNRGKASFHEKGLASLLKFHVNEGNLKAVDKLDKAFADIYILSVGTPLHKNLKPNLDFIKKSAQQIGRILRKRNVVILRSTVPVGTTRKVIIPIIEKESGLKAGEDFYIAFAPERTVEGKALEELRFLPQVIGGFNKTSCDVVSNFFSGVTSTVVRVDSLEAAEMIKLANNAFRDVTFGFANELALICSEWGLNAHRVIQAANEGYPRNIISRPSPGVGGVCLKKDPYIYIYSAKTVNCKASLSLLSRKVNEYMPTFVFNKVNKFTITHKPRKRVKIFVIGFSFKGEPETSDVRGSTTIDLIKLLKRRKNWRLYGYDPIVSRKEVEKEGVIGCSLAEGFKNADCVLIMNNHCSYEDMDILGLLGSMNKPAILFDCWNLFPKEEIERVEGIIYGGLSGEI